MEDVRDEDSHTSQQSPSSLMEGVQPVAAAVLQDSFNEDGVEGEGADFFGAPISSLGESPDIDSLSDAESLKQSEQSDGLLASLKNSDDDMSELDAGQKQASPKESEDGRSPELKTGDETQSDSGNLGDANEYADGRHVSFSTNAAAELSKSGMNEDNDSLDFIAEDSGESSSDEESALPNLKVGVGRGRARPPSARRPVPPSPRAVDGTMIPSSPRINDGAVKYGFANEAGLDSDQYENLRGPRPASRVRPQTASAARSGGSAGFPASVSHHGLSSGANSMPSSGRRLDSATPSSGRRGNSSAHGGSKDFTVEDCVRRGLIVEDTPVWIELEVCENCALHSTTTRHDPLKYSGYADQVASLVTSRLPACKVSRVLRPRIGAFEVPLPFNSVATCADIHGSKIRSRKFPNAVKLVDSLCEALPRSRSFSVHVKNARTGVGVPNANLQVKRADETGMVAAVSSTDRDGACDMVLSNGAFSVEVTAAGLWHPDTVARGSSQGRAMLSFRVSAGMAGSACTCLIPPVDPGYLWVVLTWGCTERLQLRVIGADLEESLGDSLCNVESFGPQTLSIRRPVPSGARVVVECERPGVLSSAHGVVTVVGEHRVFGAVHGSRLQGDGCVWDVCSLEDDGERLGLLPRNTLLL